MPARSHCIGRADLLRALQKADEATESRYADLLGFDPRPPEPAKEDSRAAAGIAGRSGPKVSVPVAPTETSPRLQATFFVVTQFDQRLDSDPPEPDERQPVDESLQPLEDKDCEPRGVPLPFVPLVRRERIWPRLRQSLQQQWCAGIDLPRLLQQVATRRLSSRVPRREHRHLSREIVVLWDAADRLTPYFEDYRRLVAELHRLHGGAQLRLWRVYDGPDDVWDEWDAARVARPERWPGQPWQRATRSGQSSGGLVVPPGCRLLLLSDLGGLARQTGPHQRWLRALRRWDEDGVHITAWVPHGPAWVRPTLAAVAEVHCLTPRLDRVRRTRGGGAAADSAARQQRQAALRDELLVRASICIHLEPELLRSLRQTSLTLAAETGVEALAWAYQPVVRSSHVSRALSPEHAPDYRSRFSALDAATQCDVLQRVTDAHASRGQSTEVTEVLIWQAHAQADAKQAEGQRVEQAVTWTHAWTRRMAEEFTQAGGIGEPARQFAADLLARTGSDKLFVQQHAEWTQHLWALSGRTEVPTGLDLQRAKQAQQRWSSDASSDLLATAPRWWLQENMSGLSLVKRPDSNPEQGDRLKRLCHLLARDCLIEHSDGRRWRVGSDAYPVPLAQGGQPGQWLALHYEQCQLRVEEWGKPAWAEEWGVDRNGLYGVLVVAGVHQRLRYISPGRFLMGSPEGVGGANEHPQQEVLLTEGYWLADTPCTQALWTAVMGGNPSQFQGGPEATECPVENVSWYDVRNFLQRLAELLPAGCQPTLPTEAQWEYAARAGTTTSYWWGEEFDESKANVDVLIDRVIDGSKGATTPVKQYPPNPWGLRDMHGNVWEWCLNDLLSYTPKPVRDPCGETGPSGHAVRGGSWVYHLGSARSAFRSRRLRTYRGQNLGFRFSLRSPSPVPRAEGPATVSEKKVRK